MLDPYAEQQLIDSINLGAFPRGDSIIFPVWAATYPNGPDIGEVINLAGATIWFTAKRALIDEDGATPGFQLSTLVGGVTIVDAAMGQYQVIVPPTATTGLTEPLSFQCDVQVRTAAPATPQPYTLTILRGTFSIHLDATRASG